MTDRNTTKSVNLQANEVLFALKRLYGAENDPARDGDAIAIISEPLRKSGVEIDHLTRHVADANTEIERLQTAKRRALKIADERSYENVGLKAENERLRDLISRSATMLDDAYSGYISGSREDDGFHQGKDALLAELRNAEQSPAPTERTLMVECQKCGAQVRLGSCCIKCDEPSDH